MKVRTFHLETAKMKTLISWIFFFFFIKISKLFSIFQSLPNITFVNRERTNEKKTVSALEHSQSSPTVTKLQFSPQHICLLGKNVFPLYLSVFHSSLQTFQNSSLNIFTTISSKELELILNNLN